MLMAPKIKAPSLSRIYGLTTNTHTTGTLILVLFVLCSIPALVNAATMGWDDIKLNDGQRACPCC